MQMQVTEPNIFINCNCDANHIGITFIENVRHCYLHHPTNQSSLVTLPQIKQSVSRPVVQLMQLRVKVT